ncbi:MAG TPA: WYL domain-containing protein [Gemmatimonadales bacterium]|nr:WYL domain-containing protein [Gemmatimonadales bacterium]
MLDLAQHRIERLVSLVAWMSQRDSKGPVPYRLAARHLGVTEQTLREDLDILANLTESYKPWLASLNLAFTAGGFMLGSQGAFRRPLRLTREEGLALVLGLLGSAEGRALAQRLGRGLGADPDPGAAEQSWALGPTPQERVARVLAVAREARDLHRKVDLSYCGSAGEPSRRVIQVHQVVHAGGAWYLVAWCERAGGPRHFRAERVLEIELLEERFTPRPDFPRVRKPADLLAGADHPLATVAFSPRIARWLRERYPDGQTAPDGRYLVRLPVADPHWLAREVLQYGAEAEVLEPEAMRAFLRRVIGK